ncbi:CD1247 N-terminal domain-containing protein [Dethiobacter alkaliphilus]|uniref:CD1247 N-terminal domain-containing protein n=1 Tax=Dethiobacter alkaliphilus TaxID=427926 RepID=UPI002225B7B6|nr:CD1247 N-terminal domain-containing protein [Dethiobacter alkaliphilus]MCW3490282.1 AraC family transcriptional regulator [Dethiobacter alkaliphilus]
MEDLKSRVAYLKGLAAGLGMEENTREGKLFGQIIDVIDSLAEAVTELQDDYDDIVDYAEAIDEDLNELEEDFYDEDELLVDDEDYYDEDDDEMFSVECPDCHEIVYIDDDMLDDDDVVEILCPNCERIVFVNDDEDYEGFEEDLELELENEDN